MSSQPIEINIKQDGVYDINLPFGTLVLHVDYDKVEVEQVGNQQLILSKETVLAHANDEELFCIFHTFIEYLRLIHPDLATILDSEIGKSVEKLKVNYNNLPRVIQR